MLNHARLLTFYVSVGLVACSGASATAPHSAATVALSFDSYFEQLAAIPAAQRTASITAWRTKSFDELYQDLLSRTTNDKVILGDVTYSGTHAQLTHAAANFTALQKSFGTLGGLWNATGVNPAALVSKSALVAAFHSAAAQTQPNLGLIDPAATIGIAAGVGCYAGSIALHCACAEAKKAIKKAAGSAYRYIRGQTAPTQDDEEGQELLPGAGNEEDATPTATAAPGDQTMDDLPCEDLASASSITAELAAGPSGAAGTAAATAGAHAVSRPSF